jgi:hypothetical protein
MRRELRWRGEARARESAPYLKGCEMVRPTHLNTRGGRAHRQEEEEEALIIITMRLLLLLAAAHDGAANTHTNT